MNLSLSYKKIMKNYNITVNGITYQVAVEEVGSSSVSQAVPSAAPVAPVPAVTTPKAATAGSKNAVKADVPGKITQILVKEGQEIKSGDTVLMLEAMKMEIPVVTGIDGVVSSVLVTVGQNVESGEALVAMN